MPTRRKRGGQPGNTNARKHGFYSDRFSEDELALVAAFVTDLTLDDEIWMQRVVNRRLLTISTTEGKDPEILQAETETLIHIVQALAIGTGRVARLLRDKRALSDEAADGLLGAIAVAVNEVSTQMELGL